MRRYDDVTTDLARRSGQGWALPRRIVLSFAPSAAAGGQGHRMSTTWSATQHDRAFFLALGRAMCFNSFGTVPPVFTPKMVLKQDGMLAFFQASGRCRTDVLQSILVAFSLPGDPWSFPDPLQSPSGVSGRFFDGFLASREGPWDSFWTLCPRASLGATLAVTLAPKVGIKERKRTHPTHVALSNRF